jgi:hypothetical protein
MYLSPEDRYIQGAKEHGNTEKIEEIYVRAYHQHDAMNPLHREQKFNKDDDVRTLPTNPNHRDISWVSCKYHWCEHHRQSKEDNDCFPVTIPGTPNNNPYHEWETYGYSAHHWHENLGVATLRFNLAHYRQIHKTKELLEGIKHSQQLIEEAEREFEKATQGKYADKKEGIMRQQIGIGQIDHPIKWPSTDDATSDTTEELQGQWEDDGLHLRNDPVDPQRLNEITTTEDTDSDESSLEKEHIFEPIDLREGFDQVPINDEQSGQGITPDERDAELEEHFQQQLFDEEFINDCPNGEGCNNSDCEQTHRDASGKVTRHL